MSVGQPYRVGPGEWANKLERNLPSLLWFRTDVVLHTLSRPEELIVFRVEMLEIVQTN